MSHGFCLGCVGLVLHQLRLCLVRRGRPLGGAGGPPRRCCGLLSSPRRCAGRLGLPLGIIPRRLRFTLRGLRPARRAPRLNAEDRGEDDRQPRGLNSP
jgi:hypothetical protein